MINPKYVQWKIGAEGYYPCFETKRVLDPGMYTVEPDSNHDFMFSLKPIKDEAFYIFKDSVFPKVIKEAKKFWDSKEVYESKSMPWKRGLLLYGKPGNGKSGLINLLIHEIISRGGLALFPTSNSFDQFKRLMSSFYQIEKGRPSLIVLEEFDEIIRESERDALEFLDGTSMSIHGGLIIGTTNYLNDLPDRFKARPSRFDLCIEIEHPVDSIRRQYCEKILNSIKYLDEIVECTRGLSMAHVKEAVLLADIYKLPIEEIKERLQGPSSKLI